MTPTEEAAREEVEKAREADAHRQSKKTTILRLVDHAHFNDGIINARFNDGTSNASHNDEIINGESIPIYSFIVLEVFIYDGLSRGNCCYCEHIKDDPCFNGATSAQNC
ncbi:hypothetical protein TNCV_1137501 [Trichonephila clavipes]|nr:hypothetical protein TNCV_1137501 [Trichonephila clavipes]